MLIAITRGVSPDIEKCELTHLERQLINITKAREQHGEYENCLDELGCRVVRLAEESGMPDSVFVEDSAVVLDELAIICRPGAESRRAETDSIAKALEPYRSLFSIKFPGTLDGGDVMLMGKTLYTGISSRTNRSGIKQLENHVRPFGYDVMPVEVRNCLHLKSAVSVLGENSVLMNRDWLDESRFRDRECIETDPDEPFGANALRVGTVIVYNRSFPRTRERLEKCSLSVKTVDLSELAKAEGGVTCCSLIFQG